MSFNGNLREGLTFDDVLLVPQKSSIIPSGVCSRMISFDLSDDGRIHNLAFLAGCPGNLRAISKLVEGQDAKRVAEILKGNQCGPRPTSCADQLSKALIQAIEENK